MRYFRFSSKTIWLKCTWIFMPGIVFLFLKHECRWCEISGAYKKNTHKPKKTLLLFQFSPIVMLSRHFCCAYLDLLLQSSQQCLAFRNVICKSFKPKMCKHIDGLKMAYLSSFLAIRASSFFCLFCCVVGRVFSPWFLFLRYHLRFSWHYHYPCFVIWKIAPQFFWKNTHLK